jgi:thioredoxin 1
MLSEFARQDGKDFSTANLPTICQRKSWSDTMSAVIELTAESFEARVMHADRPVLVDFFHQHCGPCRRMAPVLEELAATLDGAATVGKLNVIDHPGTAQDFRITVVPSFLVFKGGQPVARLVGMQSSQRLLAAVRQVT